MLTSERINITLTQELAEAARRKSKETGVPVSAAIERLLRNWVLTGELPSLQDLPEEKTSSESAKGGTKRKRTK